MLDTTNTATAELATLIRLETRSQELRRAALESEFAQANRSNLLEVGAIRAELKRVDSALMEIAAGRLPAR